MSEQFESIRKGLEEAIAYERSLRDLVAEHLGQNPNVLDLRNDGE